MQIKSILLKKKEEAALKAVIANAVKQSPISFINEISSVVPPSQ